LLDSLLQEAQKLPHSHSGIESVQIPAGGQKSGSEQVGVKDSKAFRLDNPSSDSTPTRPGDVAVASDTSQSQNMSSPPPPPSSEGQLTEQVQPQTVPTKVLNQGVEDFDQNSEDSISLLVNLSQESESFDTVDGKDHQPPCSDSLDTIMARVGKEEESHEGLVQLHNYQRLVPNVDLEPFLQTCSHRFRAYIDEELRKIDFAANCAPGIAGAQDARNSCSIASNASSMSVSPSCETKDNEGLGHAADTDLDDHLEFDLYDDQITTSSVAPAKRKSVTQCSNKPSKIMAITEEIPDMTDGEESGGEDEDDDDIPLVGLPLRKNKAADMPPSVPLENRLQQKNVKKRKQPKKKPKKKVAFKHRQYQDEDIPYNPHNLHYEDDEGNALTPGSSAVLAKFAKSHKLTKRTQARYNVEHKRFEAFIVKTAGAQTLANYLSSSLPPQQVADLVSDYLLNRINLSVWRTTGKKQYLDTTTARLVWAKISRVMRQKTNYNMSTMPAFQSSKDSLSTYLEGAKDVGGLGENAGQANGLSRVQLSYLLHHDFLSMYTPVGLVSLFYMSFVITFFPRVREEAKRVTRGDFKRIMNPDGTVRCVVYGPRGKCKRDRGSRAGDKGAAVFKRPIALPSKEPKISFPVILDTMEAHLDLLPWEGDRADQPMFMMFHNTTPKAGQSFFMNKELGQIKFDNIMKNVIRSSGLKTKPSQQCNQALLPTAFGIHKLLGLDTSYFMSMAGHVSGRTHTLYVRNQVELLEGVTGNFLEFTTGVEAVRPVNDTVEIYDTVTQRTEVRRVKDFLPLVQANGKQTSIFPLSGIDYEELFTLLPEVRDKSDKLDPVRTVSTTPTYPNFTFTRPSDKVTSTPTNSRKPITPTLLDTSPLDLSPARDLQPSAEDLSCSLPLNLVTPISKSSKAVLQAAVQSTSDPGPYNKSTTRSDFSFRQPRIQLTNRLPLTSSSQNLAMVMGSPSKMLGLNLTSSNMQH